MRTSPLPDLWNAVTRSRAIELPGPILVIGADGFIGKNLVASLRHARRSFADVHTLVRGETLPGGLLPGASGDTTPRVIFNLAAHGAYEDQTDAEDIYETNFGLVRRMVTDAHKWASPVAAFINAGSSSEYGENSNSPRETDWPTPNSHYAMAKVCAQAFLDFAARQWSFPSYHLRLYSVFGPHERKTRLIPTMLAAGMRGEHANYADPQITRDFVFVDDATAAMVAAAWTLANKKQSSKHMLGGPINIATGKSTSLARVAEWAKWRFALLGNAPITHPARKWDHQNTWVGDASRARHEIFWVADTTFEDGLEQTIKWMKENP